MKKMQSIIIENSLRPFSWALSIVKNGFIHLGGIEFKQPVLNEQNLSVR